MYIILVICTIVSYALADDVTYYDTFTGKSLSTEEYKQYIKANITFWCAGSYKKCDYTEGRRIDTTCNNLQYPYRGPPHTPSSRELPAKFSDDNSPVKAKSGRELPPARKARTETLLGGTIPDQTFSALTAHYMLFMVNGVTSIHDTVNYVRWVTTCCQPEVKKHPLCYPMAVPADDTVHQFSGIRCMNMTKPLTFQNVGCTKNNASTPERINSASNFLDLSMVYSFDNSYRTMEDGLLKVDEENGKIWPVGSGPPNLYCVHNELPRETRCHKNVPINGLLGTNFFSIQFWRLHNYIARELKKINPHWCDEQLFSTAKDINTALSVQMYYYELMPLFMGQTNLLKDDVISAYSGLRKTYNESLIPQVSMEYIYALRWGHTIQPGMAKMYDCKGNYLKQIPSTNLTLRTGYYAIDDHMEGITQGTFRQPMGNIDHVVEPQIAETGFGYLQRAFDITAADLIKGGLLGIAPYVEYRRLCSGNNYKSFKDLIANDDMEPEYVEIVKGLYENVEDIPLMVGIWLEKKIFAGYAPKTLYCLKVRQMKRFRDYDRHWYENSERPNAFTDQQIAEIRKATMAWLLCTVGDSVDHIQPQAFLRDGPWNKMTSCAHITKVDFNAWKDSNQKEK